MEYSSKWYDNFDALIEGDRQTANLLLKELGLDASDIDDEPWVGDMLAVYPNVEEFAKYELIDGWYMNHDFGGDYKGAPSPFDFIDLEAFGNELIATGDDSRQCQLPNGKVVTTDYGW